MGKNIGEFSCLDYVYGGESFGKWPTNKNTNTEYSVYLREKTWAIGQFAIVFSCQCFPLYGTSNV